MWLLEKEIVISSAHHLNNYVGKCKNIHGHNWKVIVYCKGDRLDKAGMLIDFGRIKEEVMNLDHRDLNEILDKNPTAENIAEYLCHGIPYCYQVKIEEQEGSTCIYVKS